MTELATTGVNPWLIASTTLSGGDTKPILRFEKGDWLLGQDKKELKLGTLLLANMAGVEWGWVRWQESRPTDRRMGLLAEGYQVEPRDALPDRDKDMWDLDDKGYKRDPWQKMIEIPVRIPDGEELLMAGGSRGWEGCCKALFEAYGKGLKEGKQGTPVIKLGGSHYDHKMYGRVKVPVLELVEWRTGEVKKKLTKF